MNRLAVLGRAVAAGVALALAGTGHAAGLIDPALEEVLRTAPPNETVSTIFFLADQVDVKGLTQDLDQAKVRLRRRHEVVVRSLQQTADVTNRDMLAHLATLGTTNRVSSFDPYWIVNAIRVDAVPAEIIALADRPGVQRVYYNHELEIIEPVGEAVEGGGGTLLGAPEPGVEAVRAPEVWALGYTGAGVLVANIDTGVDGNHPALASRWAGVADLKYAGHPEWAWYDPHFGDNSFPYDDGGHGTHTMGSVCGGSPGDQVGVAPGAHWIAAAAIDRPGADIPTTVAHAIEAFQWMVDPDGNPTTSWDVPAVCSNSWGVTTGHGYPECDELFWSFLDSMEAAGTVVVFSAGNEGSTGLRRPSDRATDDYRTLAVAAVDANDPGWPIASFSSRGPTFCTPDGSEAIKPDISAPGVNVRSSVPGGGYSSLNGTSMASPHINGVIALMREANPDLSVEQIKQILYDTAVDLGTPGEDNSYGHGMVDAYEAVQLALSTVGLTFEYPNGRPDLVDPSGGTTIRVNVDGQSVAPEPGTGLLYYRTGGGGFTAVAMNEVTPNVYDATFPAFDCGAKVDYYFSAETEEGDLAFNPYSAPDAFYSADAYTGIMVTYDDDFETDNGWTVENIALEDGQWDRGVPIGGGDRGDPATDADGSGQCWLTDNEDDNSDVDGGPTILTSSQLDASGLPEATLQYARWFTNDDSDIDRLTVEISDDNGASWTLIESVPGSGGWQTVSHRIADYVTPNDQIRVRFSATDNPNDSVTEAGLDAVKIMSFYCEESGCVGDLDGSGDLGFSDLLDILANWGPCAGCPQDLDGDDQVGFTDVLHILSNWGPCP